MTWMSSFRCFPDVVGFFALFRAFSCLEVWIVDCWPSSLNHNDLRNCCWAISTFLSQNFLTLWFSTLEPETPGQDHRGYFFSICSSTSIESLVSWPCAIWILLRTGHQLDIYLFITRIKAKMTITAAEYSLYLFFFSWCWLSVSVSAFTDVFVFAKERRDILTATEEFRLNPSTRAAVYSSFYLGWLFGDPFFGWIADKWGRQVMMRTPLTLSLKW